MSLILEYFSLQDRLAEIENSPEFSREKEFYEKLSKLLNDYGMTAKQAIAMLSAEESPSTPQKVAKPADGKRPRTAIQRVWRNPETGEERTATTIRGVQDWVNQYGKDTVQQWQVTQH